MVVCGIGGNWFGYEMESRRDFGDKTVMGVMVKGKDCGY
jgi:hypothetical protein